MDMQGTREQLESILKNGKGKVGNIVLVLQQLQLQGEVPACATRLSIVSLGNYFWTSTVPCKSV
jgi:hypothetical protein